MSRGDFRRMSRVGVPCSHFRRSVGTRGLYFVRLRERARPRRPPSVLGHGRRGDGCDRLRPAWSVMGIYPAEAWVLSCGAARALANTLARSGLLKNRNCAEHIVEVDTVGWRCQNRPHLPSRNLETCQNFTNL